MALEELKKLLKSPKITFEKGIEHTSNDQHLGFVSKLENMEVVNGAVQNRKGSTVLNDTSEQESFVVLQNVSVSGCEFLLGINTKREVKAWFPRAIQKTMTVMRQAITPFMDNTTIKNLNYKFQFKRGDRFFIESGLQFIMVFNNYGDIFRINKRGYIQYTEIGNSDTWTPEDADLKPIEITGARSYGHAEIGLFLDIEEMTHKFIQDFNLYTDLSGSVVPIKNDVRIAHINEAGKLGKFSDSIGSTDWRSLIVSRIQLLSATPKSEPLDLVGGGFHTYIELQATRTGIVHQGVSNPNKSYVTLDSYQLRDTGYRPVSTYTLDPDITENGDCEWKNIYLFEHNNRLCFYLKDNTDALIDITSSKSSGFIKIKDVEWFDMNESNMTITGGQIDDSWVKRTAESCTTYVEAVTAYDNTGDNILPSTLASMNYALGTYTAKSSVNCTANRQVFTLSSRNTAIQLGASSAPKKNLKFEDSASGAGWSTLSMTPFGRAKVLVDIDDDVLATASFEYDSIELPSEALLLRDKGYDCWDMEEIEINSGFINFVNVATGNILINETSSDRPTAYCDRDLFKAYLLNGERFAVWNNGYVVAESQEMFQDITLDYPAYTTDGSYTTSRYASKPKVDFKKSNLPITALTYQSLRRYPHNINEFEEHVTNPQEVSISSGNLFVVQGNRLWLGSADRMVLSGTIDFDSPVNFIEKAGSGVIAFTEVGIAEVKHTGTVSNIDTSQINDTTAKATYSGKGGTFAVMQDDSVVRIVLVTEGVRVPFYRAMPVAGQLPDKTWGDKPILQYAGNTFYIGHDSEVWGLEQGLWIKRYNFEGYKINALAELQGELVVSFDDKADEGLKYDDDDPDTSWVI